MSLRLLALIARRILFGVVLLLAVSVLIFAGTQILPGDVAQAILGQSATPQSLANLRNQLGLDEPAYIRYFNWLHGFLSGDLGKSLSTGQDIALSISERLANTLFLAACAAAVAVPLAILLGLVSVRYHNRMPDKIISTLSLASTSVPEFFIGYVLVYFFAIKWQLFPPISVVYDGMPFLSRLRAVALPAASLSLVVMAHMMRMTRAAVLNVMQSAYIETAELKGLTPFQVIRRHAFPNVLAPVISVIMLNLAYLIAGVVVIEVIFVYPGMGQYLVDHVSKRDVPVVQAVGLIFAAVYIILNTAADIASLVANPRLRHPR